MPLAHLYPPHSSRRHPCTRIFQALRIAVNDELSLLKKFLQEAFSLLRPGGRLAVITFHSLEDSIVKKAFALWDADHYPMEEGADYPLPKEREGKRVQRKPFVATAQEIEENPRSRSAKLRCIEKC